MKRYSVSLPIKDINPNHSQVPLHIHWDGQNKKNRNKGWRRCREIRLLRDCWWECKRVQLLWKQLPSSSNVQQWVPYDSAVSFLDIYLREMKTYVHTNTCTRMFIAALFIMNQQNVLCPSNAVLFRHKIILNIISHKIIDAGCNMDEPWKYNVKWKKPVTREQVLHDSIYTKCPVGKSIDRK